MSKSETKSLSGFRFALADSIAFLNPDHWDSVAASSGLFLSRPFLRLLEENLPPNLCVHYAIVYEGDRPVATVVVQSLGIRVADLSAGHLPKMEPGFWHSLGKASKRSISRARRQILIYDNPVPWPLREEDVAAALPGELWGDVALGLWHRFRHMLKVAERAAELPVAWIRVRFQVCGNFFSTGPHGAAFVAGEDPARLWPAVVEALYRIRRSSRIFGESNMVLIKDLTDDNAGAGAALRRSGFRRFETEPNMVLQLKPEWTSFDDYLSDMKSDYRSRIRKTLQSLGKAGIVIECLDPGQVDARAAEIHGLYHQVHDHQKLRLVTIGEKWIPALARQYQNDFRTVVIRYKDDGRILGFVTLIRDMESAIGYYIGFDKDAAASDLPLYVSLIYASIAQVIEMRASRFVMGRTALEPKAQIGATAQATYGYLRHRSPAINLAVPSILAVLPAPEQAPERHPFKNLNQSFL